MPHLIIKNKADLPPLPEGLTDDFTNLYAPFGFKIINLNGQKVWTPGTEADFRRAESERLGIPEDQVSLNMFCRQSGPRSCDGLCPGTGGGGPSGTCQTYYDPANQYYRCCCC